MNVELESGEGALGGQRQLVPCRQLANRFEGGRVDTQGEAGGNQSAGGRQEWLCKKQRQDQSSCCFTGRRWVMETWAGAESCLCLHSLSESAVSEIDE
jgi:hypothetical protein